MQGLELGLELAAALLGTEVKEGMPGKEAREQLGATSLVMALCREGLVRLRAYLSSKNRRRLRRAEET